MTTPAPHRREGLMVFVDGLRLEAGIGIHDHEQGRLQTLIVSVRLDLGPHAVEDLDDTLNYEAVSRACLEAAGRGHIGLVEVFAERVAEACISDPRVRRAWIRVEKPGALGGEAVPGCELTLAR